MRPRTLAVAALLLVAGAPALAKDGGGTKAPKRLFAESAMLRLTIQAPFDAILRGAVPVETPQPGTLTVAGSAPETLAITLSPRGLNRRKRETCPFPPLTVAFPDKPPSGSLFKGQGKLKLVTHCRTGADHQQYLLLEYAAYRLYNVLTPQSFAVRLARIDYVDASSRPLTTRLGFLIEDVDDMAARGGLKEGKRPDVVPRAQLDPAAAVRLALFQMLISNLDWSMNAGAPGNGCCHNSRLIGPKGATAGLIPVPYDFDQSGLVSAPYAAPPASIPVANVRVRRYRGFCQHNAEVAPQAAAFLARQGQLLAVIDEVPELSSRNRERAKAFLGEFFPLLDGTPEMLARLTKTCT